METWTRTSVRGVKVTNVSEFIGVSINVQNSIQYGYDIGSAGRVILHDSHIIPGSGFAVRMNGVFADFVLQDFKGNYWGTTDPNEVAAMIWDFNDDQTMNSVVDFLPMAEGAVATDEITLDGLKAMYR